jgi:hypothetical protein
MIPRKKFIVIKESDIEKYSNPHKSFLDVLNDIQNGRKKDCKLDHKYYIINQLEPYANLVWDLIVHWEILRNRERMCGETTYQEFKNRLEKTETNEHDYKTIDEFDIFKK